MEQFNYCFTLKMKQLKLDWTRLYWYAKETTSMSSSESLYKKVLHLREGAKPISELSIWGGSELKTDGFNAKGPAVSRVD